MTDSLFEIYIHIVFGTWRYFYQIPDDILPQLHAYISRIYASHKCHDISVGGIGNHVHILTSLPKDITVPEIVKITKNATNKLLNDKFNLTKFSWQQGYAAFSVNPNNVDKVKRYIAHQKEHHAFSTFEDELKKFAKLCGY